MRITSSGIIRNEDKPRVGVISIHSLADWVIDDIETEGIDITWEEFTEDLQRKVDSGEMTEDAAEKERDYAEFDSRIILFGDWVKNESGQYEINRNGRCGFAAEYNSGTGQVCVEYSQSVMRCNHTSPCYVMANGDGPCGNLDSPGDSVIAYCLPPDWLRTEE